MTTRLGLSLATALTVAAALTLTAPFARAAGPTYYTVAQAASGAKAYQTSCSQCHGAQLQGVSAPPLKGSSIKGSRTIAQLYSFVSQQMPAGAPGSLSAPTYLSITAYLLQQNGFAAGTTPLTGASVQKISAKI